MTCTNIQKKGKKNSRLVTIFGALAVDRFCFPSWTGLHDGSNTDRQTVRQRRRRIRCPEQSEREEETELPAPPPTRRKNEKQVASKQVTALSA